MRALSFGFVKSTCYSFTACHETHVSFPLIREGVF